MRRVANLLLDDKAHTGLKRLHNSSLNDRYQFSARAAIASGTCMDEDSCAVGHELDCSLQGVVAEETTLPENQRKAALRLADLRPWGTRPKATTELDLHSSKGTYWNLLSVDRAKNADLATSVRVKHIVAHPKIFRLLVLEQHWEHVRHVAAAMHIKLLETVTDAKVLKEGQRGGRCQDWGQAHQVNQRNRALRGGLAERSGLVREQIGAE